jgi:murein L,D-transpeptidase YcbB/YkuD
MPLRLAKSSTSLLAIAVFATVAGAPTGKAIAQVKPRNQPQNIFEAVFPDLLRQRVERERALQQQNAPQPEKISAPQYYTYKPEKLVAVKLSTLADVSQVKSAAAQPASGEQLIASVSTVLSDETSSQNPGGRNAFVRLMPALEGVELLAEPAIAKAVLAHYEAKPAALWLDENLQPTVFAHSLLSILSAAGRYGLDPADYAVQLPAAGEGGAIDPATAARFEFTLTARAVRYALDAANGRIVPDKLSGYHDLPQRNLTAQSAMEKIAAQTPALVLPAFHPDNARYHALVAELERLAAQSDDTIALPVEILLKPGESHEALPTIIEAISKRASPQLKAEFAAVFAAKPINAPTPQGDPASATSGQGSVVETQALPAPSAATAAALAVATSAASTAQVVEAEPVISTLYSEDKVALVKAFQKEAGLGPDGVIGRNTIAKLTGESVAAKREKVVIALEQLRWLPHQFGSRHVFINQPQFKARYVEGGVTKIDMRVVVGTKANQTSFFHDMIETVEYNPYWGVPQSILVNEYLPKLRENPAYLDERGYEVTDNNGNRIPSSAIDWWAMSGSVPYNVRQSPGEANALGELKILFPNKHAIYMHDTPARELFKKDFRAFSHGCVRLAEPRVMAAAVLGKDLAHVEARLSQGHGQDDVPQKFPIYVAYFTAWPDDEGKVEYFADMYARDEAVKKAIAATVAERNAAG